MLEVTVKSSAHNKAAIIKYIEIERYCTDQQSFRSIGVFVWTQNDKLGTKNVNREAYQIKNWKL
jgi:hypothetical protein